MNLAGSTSEQGRYDARLDDSAIEDARKAVETRDIHVNRAQLATALQNRATNKHVIGEDCLGDLEAALAEWSKLVQAEPGVVTHRHSRGMALALFCEVLRAKGRQQEMLDAARAALSEFEEAERLHPDLRAIQAGQVRRLKALLQK